MIAFGKLAGLLLLSAIKFFLAPTASILAGFGFWETIVITIIGGFIGYFAFYSFGTYIQAAIQKLIRKKRKLRINKRNRLIVKVKSKYGLVGLALLSPCLFSIPLGALLASIYFRKDRKTSLYFLCSIVIWSFVLTFLSITLYSI